ncbi:MAG: S46 family peptidase [Gemmatimonadales bacterium]
MYGADGQPDRTSNWYTWGKDGVNPGDAVFVIGNPGSTSRLKAMAQLEYERAVSVPAQVGFLSSTRWCATTSTCRRGAVT